MSERYAAVGEFIDAHPDAAIDPTVRRIVTAARDIPAIGWCATAARCDRLRAVAMAALDGVDALMVPTAPMHPRIDEVAADPVGVNSRMGTYTNFCNLFDLCGVACPQARPGEAQFGITVLARAFDDAVALDIAALGRESKRHKMFGRSPSPTPSSWWCSARTCAAARWPISSPISARAGRAS